jgi:hypothetical protein
MPDDLVTQQEVHDAVFLEILSNKNGGPILSDIDKAHMVADAAFHALKAKGLLKEKSRAN